MLASMPVRWHSRNLASSDTRYSFLRWRDRRWFSRRRTALSLLGLAVLAGFVIAVVARGVYTAAAGYRQRAGGRRALGLWLRAGDGGEEYDDGASERPEADHRIRNPRRWVWAFATSWQRSCYHFYIRRPGSAGQPKQAK